MFRSHIIFLLLLAALPWAAFGQVSVIGDLSQDRTVRPGETYEGTIQVRNETSQSQDARVYVRDYLFTFTGTNTYGEPGSHARSNARWITFTPSNLSLPPQAMATVNYRVTVPKDTSLNGTYWCMLMVEGIGATPTPTSEKKDPQEREMGLTQTIRYGIQIADHIFGTGNRSVKVLQSQLVSGADSSRILQSDLENDGQIGIRPDVYAEVYNTQGTLMGKFPGQRFRMYPGTSVRQRIDLSSLPRGSYKVLVIIDAGGDEAFAAEYSLKW